MPNDKLDQAKLLDKLSDAFKDQALQAQRDGQLEHSLLLLYISGALNRAAQDVLNEAT